MQTQIQKWGNSLALRLPSKLLSHLNLRGGSTVTIILEGDHLLIQPKKYQLDEFLEKITSGNTHHQLLEDQRVGQEEW